MDHQYLIELPNISQVLASKLKQAGINNTQELYSVGAKEAFFRIRQFDEGACINMLYALEGAVQGIRWHKLDGLSKFEMKEFYDFLTIQGPLKESK